MKKFLAILLALALVCGGAVWAADSLLQMETGRSESTVTVSVALNEEISDEVSDMLTQADDLIAHPTPDPVVQPEAIDVPVPPPIVLEEDTEGDPSEEVPVKETDEENSSAEDTEDTPVKKQKKTWLPP